MLSPYRQTSFEPSEELEPSRIKCTPVPEHILHELLSEQFQSSFRSLMVSRGYVCRDDADGILTFVINPELATEASSHTDPAKLYDICNLFDKRGIISVDPRHIVNKGGSTILTCASIQLIEPVIQSGEPPLPFPIFAAQPVIRSQFMKNIQPGYLSAFVNLGTMQANIQPQEHFDIAEKWLDVLFELGLRGENLSFKLLPKSERAWGRTHLHFLSVTVSHLALEIGEFNFLYGYNQAGILTVSDCGFGLERIRWCVSQQSDFFEEALGPKLPDYRDPILLDNLRALVLLAGHQVQPSNKDEGYRFRRYSKELVARHYASDRLPLEPLVESFYEEWSRWTVLPASLEDVQTNIKQENKRNIQRLILIELEERGKALDININLAKDRFLSGLLNSGVSAPDIRRLEEKYSGEWSQW
jgi:hypothetical protein